MSMAKFNLSTSFIYKWRYIIGYGVVGVALIAALIFAGLHVPGGLSESEINSVARSSSLSFGNIDSFSVTNLPYYILQSVIFDLFGISMLTIKLPSFILAILSAVGLILLLRRWFRQNIAVLASAIAITTGQFLFISQNGAPGILYLFWSVWLLFFGIQVAYRRKPRTLHKIAFFVTAALSLYTPLSIYVLIALVSAVFLHPHLRYLLRQLSRARILVGLLVAFVLTVPLIVMVIRDPSLGLALTGIPSALPDFTANLQSLYSQYFGFFNTTESPLMTPIFGLGTFILILFGIYRLIRTRDTAKNYVIILWTLLLLPILILNPDFTSIMFLPSVLLLTYGLTALLSYWYKLFPLNPYARITGLIPIIIIVATLVFSGLDRYIYGYRYDPTAQSAFSRDINLIDDNTQDILVTKAELPFYNALSTSRGFSVHTSTPEVDSFWATRVAKGDFDGYHISRIITDYTSNNADRFYLYTKDID